MTLPGTLAVKRGVRRYLGENVPNARPFSILVPGALNLMELHLYNGLIHEIYLVGSCGRAPEKVVREGVKEQRFFRGVSKCYRAQEEENPDHPHRQSRLTWTSKLSGDNSNRERVHCKPTSQGENDDQSYHLHWLLSIASLMCSSSKD